jgi:hypothetical protein
MFNKNEFQQYAVKHLGMNSMHLDNYMAASVNVPNIRAFTPAVIEERPMHAQAIDVFSRLMMDRIIFMGGAGQRLRFERDTGAIALFGKRRPETRRANVHQQPRRFGHRWSGHL